MKPVPPEGALEGFIWGILWGVSPMLILIPIDLLLGLGYTPKFLNFWPMMLKIFIIELFN